MAWVEHTITTERATDCNDRASQHKRTTSGYQQRTPVHRDERLKAAMQARQQRWMDEMKAREERHSPAWLRRARANRTES